MPNTSKEKAVKVVGVGAMVVGGVVFMVGAAITSPVTVIAGGYIFVAGALAFLIASDLEQKKLSRAADPILNALDRAAECAKDPEKQAQWVSEQSKARRARAMRVTASLSTAAKRRVAGLEKKMQQVEQDEQSIPERARPLGWVRKPVRVEPLDLTIGGATTWPKRGLTSKATGSRPVRFFNKPITGAATEVPALTA